MDTDASRFQVLLAEDDPVSREFLGEAIRACGAAVTACEDGPAALTLARTRRWDLLILDHQLPDLDGDAVLVALRTDPAARSQATPAIATSAEVDSVAAALLRLGFAEVLAKPMDMRTLRAALRRHGCVPPGLPLDDDDALRACGSPQAVTRLRRLFAEQELPKVQNELDNFARMPQALRPTLHRLRASCGFCGAQTLAQACAALHRVLATTDARDHEVQASLAAFRHALAETRAALRAALEGDA
jgi:CheY-like chemotaxis protein